MAQPRLWTHHLRLPVPLGKAAERLDRRESKVRPLDSLSHDQNSYVAMAQLPKLYACISSSDSWLK